MRTGFGIGRGGRQRVYRLEDVERALTAPRLARRIAVRRPVPEGLTDLSAEAQRAGVLRFSLRKRLDEAGIPRFSRVLGKGGPTVLYRIEDVARFLAIAHFRHRRRRRKETT